MNTSGPILREERTKNIEDLKLLNDKKNIFQKSFQKALKNKKDLEVVFEIKIDYLILIILKKD